jgi:hypothetical protein
MNIELLLRQLKVFTETSDSRDVLASLGGSPSPRRLLTNCLTAAQDSYAGAGCRDLLTRAGAPLHR